MLKPAIVAALAATMAGCMFSEQVESFVGPTMGSTYSVKYVQRRGTPAKEELQRETEAILADLDRQVSTYRSDSDIERFNTLPTGSCAAVPDEVRTLVAAGERLSVESEGALDLTVGPLLDLWGFGPHGHGEQVPDAEAIAAARQRVGHQYLRIDGERLCKDAPVQVDFNSIAAGHAVDRVAARFEALGVDSYLVEITGELKARGHKPDGTPWRIAIEAPHDNERVAQRIIALDGYAVSTSGDYRNFFEQNGKRYSHTVDPRLGAPVAHRLAAVTVVDPSALRADGLSTVLMVLGEERGLAFAEQRGIAAFLVIRDGQAFVTKSTATFDRLFGKGDKQ
ncbi:thiamine biosynthesis lipoprotein [Azotobacter vinelandii CA]|uniref:FAD:protein FMN transferase n=4 Tax=Azotobacter group TaxID=351 RepID=C1DR08_AZOVD|nr:thiamine biosynthesis lipoprotein [Azotobacter vinelandii DJ]AGK13264.1 thiamine biosynthesis lipoprotein [Azotobacter vinelandii CA]AGK17556.1 thiamine biosynthesis lipoprotein [Azotobacter vinelandii CA6]